MIVTIVRPALPAAGAQLAGTLARLRAAHGRDVVLLDADAARGHSLSEQLDRLLARHDDVVIDAGGDGAADPAPHSLCAMRAYAAQVMSAGVAATALHLPAFRNAADMGALYEEIYQAPHALPSQCV